MNHYINAIIASGALFESTETVKNTVALTLRPRFHVQHSKAVKARRAANRRAAKARRRNR